MAQNNGSSYMDYLPGPNMAAVPQNPFYGNSYLTPRVTNELDMRDTYMAFLKYGYKIGPTIGNGSYSKVKIAERLSQKAGERFGPTVACKIVDKRKASAEFTVKFLPRELSILRYLQHPNIVTAYEIFELGPLIFVFMEYCPRGDLLELLKKSGALPEYQAQRYFFQLLKALTYLHRHWIAHRDLKCENILLDSKNNIKLTDFGFAKSCDASRSGVPILSRTFCGSAAYAAPEILQGVPYNTFLYDIWAMGCVLYIMVTGKMPFDDRDTRKMLINQRARQIAFPTESEFQVSPSCKALILRLLEPEVSLRMRLEEIHQSPWVKNMLPGVNI